MKKILTCMALMCFANFATAIETVDWWKVMESTSNKFTISFCLTAPILKPVGAALETEDFASIQAIRVRDEQGRVVPHKFRIVARAQAAALAKEHIFSPDQNIPVRFLLPVNENGETFHFPRAQSALVGRDWYKNVVLYGYGYSPPNDLESLFMNTELNPFFGLDGIRGIGELFHFGGFGLSPNLMESLFEEIIWDMMLNDQAAESGETMLSLLIKDGLEDVVEESYDNSLELLEEKIAAVAVGLARDGKVQMANAFGTASATSGAVKGIVGFGFLIKNCRDAKKDVEESCLASFERMPIAIDYSRALYRSLNLCLNAPGAGLYVVNNTMAHQLAAANTYVIPDELPKLSTSFDAFYETYKDQVNNEITQILLTQSLESTLTALYPPGKIWSGFVSSFIRRGASYAGQYTEAYYDCLRASLVLNIHMSLRNSGIVDLKRAAIESSDGFVALERAEELANLIVFDKVLARYYFKYLSAYLNNNTLSETLDWNFPGPDEAVIWSEQHDRCLTSYSAFNKSWGLLSRENYMALQEKYQAPADATLWETAESEVPSENAVAVSPLAVVSPAKFDFGSFLPAGTVSRTVKIYLGNDARPFTWSASTSSTFLSMSRTNGSVFGRQSDEIEVLCNTSTAASGDFNSSVSLTVSILDGPVISMTIPVSGSLVDSDDFFKKEIPYACTNSYLVDDGSWDVASWLGREDVLRLTCFTNGITRNPVIKFDLALPEAYEVVVTDAEIELHVSQVLHEGSRSFRVYEHLFDVSDDNCSTRQYSTGADYIAQKNISASGVVRIGGARLDALVQSWIDNPSSNKGVVIIPSTWMNCFLSSSENANGLGPKLRIQYQLPDDKKPRVVILQPRTGATINGNTVTVSGRASDEHGISSVRVNGGNVAFSGGAAGAEASFSTAIGLNPGLNEIGVAVTDGAVNENTRLETLRVYRPDFSVIGDSESLRVSQGDELTLFGRTAGTYGYNGELSLALVDVSGLQVTLSTNTIVAGNSFGITIRAGETVPCGTYTIKVEISDAERDKQLEFNVVVYDGFSPIIDVASPNQSCVYTDETNIVLRGSARDVGSSGLKTIYVRSQRGELSVTNSGTLSSWSFSVPLEGGKTLLSVNAVDNESNVSSKILEIHCKKGPSGLVNVLSPANEAIEIEPTGASLNWDAVPGANYYRVFWGQDAADLASAATNSTSDVLWRITLSPDFVFPSLPSGMTTHYKVEAVNEYGVSVSELRSFSTIGQEVYAAWRFEHLSDHIFNDVTGKGHGLYYKGSNTVTGLIGSGAGFSFAGDYAEVTNCNLSAAATLGLWFKGATTSGEATNWVSLVFLGGTALEINGENKLRVRRGYSEWITDSVPKDQWVYLLFAIDRSSNRMRISVFSENRWKHTNCSAVIPSLSSELRIGNPIVSSNYFSGVIDDLSLLSGYIHESDCEKYIARALKEVRFTYTLSVCSKAETPILGSTVIFGGTHTYNCSNGVFDVNIPPQETTVDVVVPNYTFDRKNVNLPWKNYVIKLVPSDDRPFGCSVDVPGFAFLSNSVEVTAHAFDFESGTNSFFITPYRVRVGPDGYIYIIDNRHHRIYKTQSGNTLENVAGNGIGRFSGDGGLAVDASLNSPSDLTFDSTGNIIIADTANNRLRKIDLTGKITTFAGTGVMNDDTAVSGLATSCNITLPRAVKRIDTSIYFGDLGRDALLRVNTSGTISQFVQLADYEYYPGRYLAHVGDFVGLIKDTDGSIYGLNDWDYIMKLTGGTTYSVYSGNHLWDHNGDGVDVGVAGFGTPLDLVIGSGYFGANVKILADAKTRRLRYVKNGKWFTFAGNGSATFPVYGRNAASCGFAYPTSCDSDGSNVYVADEANYCVFKVDASGNIQKFFESCCVPVGSNLQYQVDFGDGVYSDWSFLRTSTHIYSTPSVYNIRTRARDISGQVSEWGALTRISVSESLGGSNTTYLNSTNVVLSQVATGQTVIARGTSIQATSNFVIGVKGNLILDNSTLFVPDGASLTIRSGGLLRAMANSVITADIISSNLDPAEAWWNDTDTAVLDFSSCRVNCRSMDLDVVRFSQNGSTFVVQGRNGVRPTFMNGSNVNIRIYATDVFSISEGSAYDVMGGAGANGVSNRENGGNGGNVTFDLRSKAGMNISADVEINADGGRGGDCGGGSDDPGKCGNGGGAVFFAQAELDVMFHDFEMDLSGGYVRDGISADTDVTAAQGGAGGFIGLSASSVSGSVSMLRFRYDGDVEDSGDGGNTSDANGAAGQAGASNFVRIACAKDLFLSQSRIDVHAGSGGMGGDGDNAGAGAVGGRMDVAFIAGERLAITNTSLSFEAGDGGDGGDGDSSGSSASGGIGQAGGVLAMEWRAPIVGLFGSSLEADAGFGGDGGRPYETHGSAGGVGGGFIWRLFAHQLSLDSSSVDMSAGDSGRGSAGDDYTSGGDNGGQGGNGAGAVVNWFVTNGLSVVNSLVSCSGGDGGDSGTGSSTALVGGAGGDMLFACTNLLGTADLNGTSFRIWGGDAEDGNNVENSSAGNGGTAGLCSFLLSSFADIMVMGAKTGTPTFDLFGGDGGDGGDSDGSYAGTPAMGGQARLALTSRANVSLSNAWVRVTGGMGGDGDDGNTVSRDSSGALGGLGTVQVVATNVTLLNLDVWVTGGAGGLGTSKPGGGGGGSEFVITADTIIKDARVFVESGRPGQSYTGAYAHESAGNFVVTGVCAVAGAILSDNALFSGAADLRKTLVHKFDKIESTRDLDLKNATKYISDFVKLAYTVPMTIDETWSLTYDIINMNWVVESSAYGVLEHRARFGERYFSPEIGVVFTLGLKDWFAWFNSDRITFTAQRKNVLAYPADAKLDAVKQISVITSDGLPYQGALTVFGYVSNAQHSAWSFSEPPYAISIPGWTVRSNNYIGVSGGSEKIRIQAPGLCLNITNFVALAGVPEYVLFADSDSDGIDDITERSLMLNPLKSDTDKDGIEDWIEVYLSAYSGANPNKKDTDGDGVSDGDEISDGTGVTNAQSFANRPPSIRHVSILPQNPLCTDQIVAAVCADDPDGDRVAIDYKWILNGNNIVDSGETILDSDHMKTNMISLGVPVARGQTICVEISAKSGNPEKHSEWTNSLTKAIMNSPPVVSCPSSVLIMPGAKKNLVLAATDADGDALAWSLLSESPILNPVTVLKSVNGTLSIDNKLLTYSPDLQYFDADEITLFCSDGIVTVEKRIVLNMRHEDTDGDGINDEEEMYVTGTDPESKDSDSDGISDGAELTLLRSNPNKVHSDLDGMSDDQEYVAGTNPSDAQSVFSVKQFAGGSLEWDSVPGRYYRILWTPSLEIDFQPVTENLFYPINSYSETLLAGYSKGFYKLSVDMPSGIDLQPPVADDLTWMIPPTNTALGAVSMSAQLLDDPSGIEYFFDETSNNLGGNSSGWQDSNIYIDSDLIPGKVYTYRVRARDKSINKNMTRFSSSESVLVVSSFDMTAPQPDPMDWIVMPYAIGSTSVTMRAATAIDTNGVEYLFEELSGNPGGTSSGWQNSTEYTDNGLLPSTTYVYRVSARDKSSSQNQTGYSESVEVQTEPAGDTVSPVPSPMDWSVKPRTNGATTVRMVAVTATDPSGVEYFFDEISGNPGADDSGWQGSPDYEDLDLTPGLNYQYRVKARDKSDRQNETEWSSNESVALPFLYDLEDLNDGAANGNWRQLVRYGINEFSNGRFQIFATDATGGIGRYLTVPVAATNVIVEFDANLAYSSPGMSVWTAAITPSLNAVTGGFGTSQNYPGGVSVTRWRVDANDSMLTYVDLPTVYTNFHCVVTYSDGFVNLSAYKQGSSERHVNLTVVVPGFDIHSITDINYLLYTTRYASPWIDNCAITVH